MSVAKKSSRKSRPRPELTHRFARAVLYAARMHAGQKRKGTKRPYLSHVLGVASVVIAYGGDEDQAIAALLHDVPEDCGGRPRLAEIRRQFGRRVARIVDGCTDTYAHPKPPWLERKRAYVARVAREPAYVRLVSAADKLHNIRDILNDYRQAGESLWRRFGGGREGALWYYRALVRAFRQGGTPPVVDDYARLVTDLNRAVARREYAIRPAKHKFVAYGKRQ